MYLPKPNLANIAAINKNMQASGSNWLRKYGCSLSSFFPPFTTQVDSTGSCKFENPISPNNYFSVSGYVNSSGLNPYGLNMLGYDIIHGTTPPSIPLGLEINSTTVRSHGIKTPSVYVGWGYDTFGYPAPNATSGWDVSGVALLGTPSSSFSSGNYGSLTDGKNIPYDNFKAGPLDLRWDCIRKVWTGPQSVYAAEIIATYLDGSLVVDGGSISKNSGYYPLRLSYGVRSFDGIASAIILNKVRPIGPQISATGIYIKPLISGMPCMIMHCNVSGKPGYGLWAIEPDYVTDCSGNAMLY